MATQLEDLRSKAKTLGGQLNSSATAYARNTAPTASDLSKDTQLSAVNKQIDDLRSTQLRNSWYGPTTKTNDEGGTPPDGWLVSGLKAIQKPLNAIAGTAQYALGKGTAPGYFDSVQNALNSGTTFGDVLKQEGAPRALQIPLGFALDVMFDPVNWATVGTEALIPRVFGGAVRGVREGGVEGGIKAATTGLTSGLEKKAAQAMSLVPFAKKSSAYRDLAAKIGEKAITGAEKYDSLVGKTVYDKLGKGIFGQPAGYLGNATEKIIRGETKVPGLGFLGKEVAPDVTRGDKIADFFKYSPNEGAKLADLSDTTTNLYKEQGLMPTRNPLNAHFDTVEEAVAPGAIAKMKNETGALVDTIVSDADGILPEFRGLVKVTDTFENAQSLLAAAGQDVQLKQLVKAYHITPPGKTGVTWYDDFIDKMKATSYGDISNFVKGKLGMEVSTAPEIEKIVQDGSEEMVRNWNSMNAIKSNVAGAVKGMSPSEWKPFEKVLTGLEAHTAFFKLLKVPLNVAGHVTNTIGNFFFGMMNGLPTYKSEWVGSLREASQLVKGNLGVTGIKKMFFDDANLLIDLADNNPARFRKLFGFNPEEIVGKISAEAKISGQVPTKFKDVMDFLGKQWSDLENAVARGEKIASLEGSVNALAEGEGDIVSKIGKKALKEELGGGYKTPSEITAAAVKNRPGITQAEELGTFTTSEMGPNKYVEMMREKLAAMAKENPNNYMYMAADKVFNAMPKAYEHIDQIQKIGATNYMTKIGLTEQELVTVSQSVSITKDDLLAPIIKNGEKLYRLKPLKAAEVAMETYMDYSAMPDFVKVMRALPIVGSNFYSFQYAMAIKTAKTAINNPAAFNKIGFLLSELNTGRSPQEKEALTAKYNQYLNSPSVVKLVGKWNIDVKNWIPIYSMNMFNPSDKTYDDSAQGKFLEGLDKLPIFQTPTGSMIKDFIIQPLVLSGTGQAPQGQFGQPLYPSFDEQGNPITPSLGTKSFYAGRTAAESVVPGAAGYLGLLGGALSPDVINAVPSYRFRGNAFAETGKSSIGATTKEEAMQKTLRSVLGTSGIPAYTLDITKTSSK